MKALPSGLSAHLAGTATTLATCWKLTRRDGLVLGFTDHDRTLAFDGQDYLPAHGLDASEAVANAGFAVGGLDVAGALTSALLTDSDLDAGRYDGARVEMWLVNWSDAGERMLLRVAEIGEVVRSDGAFRAELRGLAHRLNVPRGRLFRHLCDADLGDARCGVDLSLAAHRADATIAAVVDAHRLRLAGLDAFPVGAFDGGRIEVTAGPAAGATADIKRHDRRDGLVELDLWLPLAPQAAPGVALRLTVGCDKRFATCAERFGNAVAFRGFPHMPSADFLVGHPGLRAGRNTGDRLT